MYAVIQTGGKQYRVAVGDVLRVESLRAEAGDAIELDQVLMFADGDQLEVGAPTLARTVQAKVLGHGRGDKIRIFKLRRRQNSRTSGGHRQNYTELEITGFGGAGKQAGSEAAEKTSKKPKAKPSEDKPAAEQKAKAEETAAKVDESAPVKDAATDDLTAINGVGPVIAGKLEALGITTVAQIAELGDDDVARIDEELNFKGRIEREDWIGQAKALLKP